MIKALSPVKSKSPVLPSEIFPKSPNSTSPERNFPVNSPILNKSLASANALCNSPAEMEESGSPCLGGFKVEDEKKIFLSPKSRSLKKTESKLSISRFGLLPLEAIEESLNENQRHRIKRRTAIHKSQHLSPRIVFDGTNASKGRDTKRKMTVKAMGSVISPYAVGTQFSPNRLPAIKHGEKALKPVKSHLVIRKRREV